MHSLSNITGPVGYGETSWETGNPATPLVRQNTDKAIIARANTVPIMHVLKHYGIRVDPYNHKAICPFKAHKNGRENTPSFSVFEETNTFKCFGCGRGNQPVNFVAEMDQCQYEKAARKILQIFATDVDESLIIEVNDISERLEIMMNFSEAVYQFRQSHLSPHAMDFIEYICQVYDRSNESHKYDNEALRRLVEHCVDHINIYSPDLIWKVGFE
jgi:hypothetical protein